MLVHNVMLPFACPRASYAREGVRVALSGLAKRFAGLKQKHAVVTHSAELGT
jgi:hypothetical protein